MTITSARAAICIFDGVTRYLLASPLSIMDKGTTGVFMERNVAIRIDGMLLGANCNLDGIAHYMKNNLPEEEYMQLVKHIGRSMAELVDISKYLYSQFPDIVPTELRPPDPSEI